jgi:hypothetical protein
MKYFGSFCAVVILFGAYTSTAHAVTYSPEQVEMAVRYYFKDTPAMIGIAKCESEFRQYTDGGSVLRGGSGDAMIGVYQFHEVYHRGPARDLGYDIDTLLGNLGYAKHVHSTEGTTPWASSEYCWENSVTASVPKTPQAVSVHASGNSAPVTTAKKKTAHKDTSESEQLLTLNLYYTNEHAEVRLLQKILNKAGYLISVQGPGSPGNETNLLGALTVKALTKFQCQERIACPTLGLMQGYGVVDEKTRARLNTKARELGIS